MRIFYKILRFIIIALIIIFSAIFWYIGNQQKPNQEALENLGINFNSKSVQTSNNPASSVNLEDQNLENQKVTKPEIVTEDSIFIEDYLKSELQSFVQIDTSNYTIYKIPDTEKFNFRLKGLVLNNLIKKPPSFQTDFYLLDKKTKKLQRFMNGLQDILLVKINNQELFLVLATQENYNGLYLVDKDWQEYQFIYMRDAHPTAIASTNWPNIFKIKTEKLGKRTTEENYYLDIAKFLDKQIDFYQTEQEWLNSISNTTNNQNNQNLNNFQNSSESKSANSNNFKENTGGIQLD